MKHKNIFPKLKGKRGLSGFPYFNGKRGGSFGATTFFILATIYFIFFIIVANASENLGSMSESDYVTVELDGIEFDALMGSSYCTNPRFKFDPQTGEKSEYGSAWVDSLKCEESAGVLSQSSCETITGCAWENVTGGWWFWETTESASCIGDINATSYGVSQTTPVLGRSYVTGHTNTGLWAKYTPFSDSSPCEHPSVLKDIELCSTFSCTWEKVTPETTFNSVSTIYGTVGDIFTFRYDFGFESTGLTLLVNFLFIILPLLILILSVYYMIPLLHGG